MAQSVDEILQRSAESIDKVINEKTEQAKEYANELRQRKMQEIEPKIQSFKKTGEAYQNIVKRQSLFEAIKQGIKLGAYLRREISDGKFDAFIVVLILSLFKDLFDFVTLGTIGWLLNVAVTIALVIIFFLRKSRFKRWFIKKYLWKYVPAIIIEFIPGLSIMPVYTVATIFLKLKVDKRMSDLESQLEEVDKKTNELKNEASKL